MGKAKPRNIPCVKCGYDPLRRVVSQQEVTIRFVWKSGNVINSTGARSHWAYNKYKQAFEKVFKSHLLSLTKATGFRRITLTRVYGLGPKGGRCYDFDRDNLAQGAKPICDILKKYAIIIDDSPEWAEIHYQQEASKDGKSYIRILIEELE